MNIANPTANHRIGHIARAIATACFGLGLALASAATSSAERIWDIEAYDNCMAQIPTIPVNYDYDHWKCCKDSGGDYEHGDGAGDMGKCKSPPAEAENVPGNPAAPGQPRPPAPGGTEGVSDDPQAGTPLPTPTPRPRPGPPTLTGVG